MYSPLCFEGHVFLLPQHIQTKRKLPVLQTIMVTSGDRDRAIYSTENPQTESVTRTWNGHLPTVTVCWPGFESATNSATRTRLRLLATNDCLIKSATRTWNSNDH